MGFLKLEMENSGKKTVIVDGNIKTIMATLNEQRLLGRYCDLTLIVGNVPFPCHRCIIMASIPFFERMFNIDFSERYKNEVTVQNVDVDAFKIILDYVYTGVLEFNTDIIDNAIIMTTITDYFGLVSLSDQCLNLCKKITSVRNIFDACVCVDRYRSNNLIEFFCDYIVRNFAVLCRANDFVSLPFFILIQVIRSDFVRANSEEEILFAVNRWMMYDNDRLGDHDEHRRVRYLDELVDAIRFPYIGDDFVRMFSDSGAYDARGRSSLFSKICSLKTTDRHFVPVYPRRACEHLYFFGSNSFSTTAAADVEDDYFINVVRYNADHAFEPIPRMTMKFVGNCHQKLVVSRGKFYSLVYLKRTIRNCFQYYNHEGSKDDNWTNLSVPYHPMRAHSLVAMDDVDCIYANCSPDTDFRHINHVIQCYVKERDQWLRVEKNSDRLSGGSLLAYNNVLYLFGGFSSLLEPSDKVTMFDPRVGSWSRLTSMPKKRGFTSVERLNDRVYLTGGSNGISNFRDFHVYKSVLVYDIKADKWLPNKSMNNAMYGHSSIVFDNKLWCIADELPINIYSPTENQWTNGPVITNYFTRHIVAVTY